jgi:hydrogenase small subunit
MTYNACATMKWNGGVSWPIESGHALPRLLGAGLLGRRRLLRGLSVPPGNSGDVLLGAGAGGHAAVGAGPAS